MKVLRGTRSVLALAAAALVTGLPPTAGAALIDPTIIEIAQGGQSWRVNPFSGDLTSVENYGYARKSALLTEGPGLEEGVASLFFYRGADGLSFNVVFSAVDRNRTGKGSARWDIAVTPDPAHADADIAVRVADERGELREKKREPGLFRGNWHWDNRHTDGGVIGPLEGVFWEITLLQLDYAGLSALRVYDGLIEGNDPAYVTLELGTGPEWLIRFTDPPQPQPPPPSAPEPATLGLLGLGLAGLLAARRRRPRR